MLASQTQYIIMKAQLAGNMVFDGHAQTAEEKRRGLSAAMQQGRASTSIMQGL